jgi:hypothetical protein
MVIYTYQNLTRRLLTLLSMYLFLSIQMIAQIQGRLLCIQALHFGLGLRCGDNS